MPQALRLMQNFFKLQNQIGENWFFFLANVECIKMENYFQPILKFDEIAAGFAFQVEEINFH